MVASSSAARMPVGEEGSRRGPSLSVRTRSHRRRFEVTSPTRSSTKPIRIPRRRRRVIVRREAGATMILQGAPKPRQPTSQPESQRHDGPGTPLAQCSCESRVASGRRDYPRRRSVHRSTPRPEAKRNKVLGSGTVTVSRSELHWSASWQGGSPAYAWLVRTKARAAPSSTVDKTRWIMFAVSSPRGLLLDPSSSNWDRFLSFMLVQHAPCQPASANVYSELLDVLLEARH